MALLEYEVPVDAEVAKDVETRRRVEAVFRSGSEDEALMYVHGPAKGRVLVQARALNRLGRRIIYAAVILGAGILAAGR